MADLTGYRTAAELDWIAKIQAGCIVVREPLAAAAASIPADTAATISVPSDVEVRIHAGMTTLGGESLAPADGPDHALVVVGGLIVAEPVSEVTYRQISVVVLLLFPHGSESVVGARLTDLIGGSTAYTHSDEMQFRSLAGEVNLSGAMIANESGSPSDVLIVAGSIVIDEPVRSVGYQRIIVSGELIAPRESRDRMGSLLEVSGQAHWYRGDQPRVVRGEETYDAEFLSLVEEPLSLIVLGTVRFGPDVTNELIKRAIADIVLVGTAVVPRSGYAAVQLLARDNTGSIVLAEDAAV